MITVMTARLTHMLQVQSDHGTWVDDLALWCCESLADATRRARAIKRLPGRVVYPGRAYRLTEVATNESVAVAFEQTAGAR